VWCVGVRVLCDVCFSLCGFWRVCVCVCLCMRCTCVTFCVRVSDYMILHATQKI